MIKIYQNSNTVLCVKTLNLLSEICEFLGIKGGENWSESKVSEVIQPGFDKMIPFHLAEILRSIHRKKTEELAIFLNDQFHLEIPFEWNNTLNESKFELNMHSPSNENKKIKFQVTKKWLEENQVQFSRRIFNDDDLRLILAMDISPTPPILIKEYLRFNIFYFKNSKKFF